MFGRSMAQAAMLVLCQIVSNDAFGWDVAMAKKLIVLGKAWLWAAAALTLLAYAYVWWTEGFGQMEKSGVLSFSNGLEVFLVLAPGLLLLILGRRLRAREEKFISSFAASAGGVTDPRDE